MNTFIALLAAFGGTAGLVTAISGIVFKIVEYRKEKKGNTLDAKLKPIVDKLTAQDEELRQIRLDTTRLQLLSLIRNDPHNHDTILMVAQRYFCSLKGDWVATAEFEGWADKEHVKVPSPISRAIDERHSN